jgi:hypothetical protein
MGRKGRIGGSLVHNVVDQSRQLCTKGIGKGEGKWTAGSTHLVRHHLLHVAVLPQLIEQAVQLELTLPGCTWQPPAASRGQVGPCLCHMAGGTTCVLMASPHCTWRRLTTLYCAQRR